MQHLRNQTRGFTLVETMVTLALVSIAMMIGVPALQSGVASFRLTSATNSYFSNLMLTRSEAIKRKARVVMCKSADGASCTNLGAWDQGWLVFHDANNNAKVDPGEQVLDRQSALGGGIRLRGNQPVASYVSYTPLGETSYTSGAFQAGTFTVCHPSADGANAREIVIANSGRPRTRKLNLASCA